MIEVQSGLLKASRDQSTSFGTIAAIGTCASVSQSDFCARTPSTHMRFPSAPGPQPNLHAAKFTPRCCTHNDLASVPLATACRRARHVPCE